MLSSGTPNVQLTIEAAEAPKRRVDGVESVGGSDDDCLPTTLHAIHERKKLGDYARLVTLGSNGVNLINEDDGGSVFLDLLEGLAWIGLRLTKMAVEVVVVAWTAGVGLSQKKKRQTTPLA